MKVSNEVKPLWEYFPDQILPAACPSRVVLDHVTSKWGVLVLVALSSGTLRWGELRPGPGNQRKDARPDPADPEHDGFVHREAQPVIPPRVDYSLTGRGGELTALLLPLMEWIVANGPAIVSPP